MFLININFNKGGKFYNHITFNDYRKGIYKRNFIKNN